MALILVQALHAMTFGAFHAAAIQCVHDGFPPALRARGQALYASTSFGLGLALGHARRRADVATGRCYHYLCFCLGGEPGRHHHIMVAGATFFFCYYCQMSQSNTESKESALAIAGERLLLPGGLDEPGLRRAMSYLSRKRLDAAELFFEAREGETWQLEDGRVKGSYSTDQGVGVRAIHGEKTGFAYAD